MLQVPLQLAARDRAGVCAQQLEVLAAPLAKSGYGKYLLRLLKEAVY